MRGLRQLSAGAMVGSKADRYDLKTVSLATLDMATDVAAAGASFAADTEAAKSTGVSAGVLDVAGT